MGETKADGTKMANLTETQAVPPVTKGSKKAERNSVFSWIIVLALLGVWMSVAVVWFDLVEYSSVVGTLGGVYDADGDGDFDAEDAKVILGLPGCHSMHKTSDDALADEGSDWLKSSLALLFDALFPCEARQVGGHVAEEAKRVADTPVRKKKSARKAENYKEQQSKKKDVPLDQKAVKGSTADTFRDTESEVRPEEPVPFNEDRTSSFHPFDSKEHIDSTGELVVEALPEKTLELSATERYQDEEPYHAHMEEKKSKTKDTPGSKVLPDMTFEPESTLPLTETLHETSEPKAPSKAITESQESGHESAPEVTAETKGKKKKPKLFNKFDKIIKSEISAADKLRKKGKVEEALHAFEALVQKYPQSPRCRYGKAQAEDDVAEKLRSNEMLLKAVTTYREVAELPDTPADLIKATLKRCADRQQFLGRMRGSLATLEKLVHIFPDDITLKNDLGVAHLLIGDNKGAKGIYEEVLTVAPNDGFAKVHYGFILKSENKIAESIPYLREGLESGEPGTDDGRFYFHLGDALQRTGDVSQAYKWYEAGYQHGHFASVWQRSLYNVAGLRAQPWWSAKETGYTDLVRMLEQNWKIIRDEALLVLDAGSGQFLPEDENLRETGDWGQFTLWQQGRKVPSSCQSVPKTCAFMERYPETTTCKRGQIKFSVMQPGTHVWPHTGPTNCRLRMHLGLVIPPRGCQIRCTNQTRNWEEGKVLIFDDSFEHEVWQEADSYRLIFIVDVWHPELSQSQRHALSPI
ncbi:aspartyl/asparaginyl beta-hydroxylase isoform X3 [Electrophorus electricus]|uniref:aspartyl/asparaginyl beta-hydroxylase isoform X3 n=1 Tax=Electrophorus electricus TaxID=8005 RepID=UPI0015CFF290|nr:aspartyl/asparaginyl beta-hydroxylase isoform X3 [Electrophorus electricus]